MTRTTMPPEIDHHTLKLIVGLIAISLANLTALLSPVELASISASYHQGGWARDIFVGFLFAICAFLLAYNGNSLTEMALSKVAAVAALGVALFPCACALHPEIIPGLHGLSAAIMFTVLAALCLIFHRRARAKHRREANWRAGIYAACGVVIVTAIVVLTLDHLSGGRISLGIPRLTFHGERAGLMAFGLAWLVASRTLPFITAKDERIPVFTLHRPGAPPAP